MRTWTMALLGVIAVALLADGVTAQPPGPGRRPERPGERPGRPGGPDWRGPGRGFVSPLMRALDADSDGEVSAEEIKNAADALKKLDKNGDGKLTRDEMHPQFGRPGRPGGPARPGRPPRPRGPGGPGGGRPQPPTEE